MGADLGKLGIQNFEYIKYDENFLERLNPIVSLYHMLFRDFGFLNLTILLFIFLLIFLQFKYMKNTVSLFIFTYFFRSWNTNKKRFYPLISYFSLVLFLIFVVKKTNFASK
jgi:hypothetical protein